MEKLIVTPPPDPTAGQPIQFMQEDEPPHFLRAQALPYPDLRRVWIRVELSPFVGHPNLELALLDPAGDETAHMMMLDVQHSYISLTMHLRRPLPGQSYQLFLRLTRANQVLDQRAAPFDLIFVERDAAKAEADSLTWTERAVPITDLDPDDPMRDDEVPSVQLVSDNSAPRLCDINRPAPQPE